MRKGFFGIFRVPSVIVLSFAILHLSSGAVSAQSKSMHEYRIAPHNLLEISVYEEKDLSMTVRVSNEGDISYPLVGTIRVTGMTVKELEDKLKELLEKDYLNDPQVSVFIKEYSKVYVLGQVKNPGAYEMRAGLTAVGAIALAGGLTDIARGNGTKIIRVYGNAKKTISVPVDTILRGKDKSKDVLVEPDDTISVPEAAF